MMQRGRRGDPRFKRARMVVVAGAVGLVVLGSFLLYSMWQMSKGQPAQALFQQAGDLVEAGDDVGAAALIARARKRTEDPSVEAKLEKLYRKIIIKQRLKVVQRLISSSRYVDARLQLRSVLKEDPKNQTAGLLLRTVEAAIVANEAKKGGAIVPSEGSAQAVGR